MAYPRRGSTITVRRQTLAHDETDIAQRIENLVENYAALLRETGRSAGAAEMEARAEAIRGQMGNVGLDV